MLDQMQGRAVENLLFDYYDCVRKISFLEANHNEILKLHWEQAKLVWPDTMESWEFGDPTALSPKRLAGLMPVIKNYLSSRSIFDLLEHAAQAAPLLLEYERLERLGTVYLKTVESGSLDLDAESLALLNGIHDPDGVTGYPEIIRNGQIAYGHFELLWADSLDWRIAGGVQDSADGRKLSTTFEINSIVRMDDSLYMRYPGGADWAAHSIIVRGSGDRRSSRDYSIYSKLVLELKGEKGGETILVNLKDRDDPDDGSQTNIELILTQQWQTYEIDLGEFDNADLAKLHLTLGFLFGNEPQAFFIRSAVYQ
jgi:hypothetical protein